MLWCQFILLMCFYKNFIWTQRDTLMVKEHFRRLSFITLQFSLSDFRTVTSQLLTRGPSPGEGGWGPRMTSWPGSSLETLDTPCPGTRPWPPSPPGWASGQSWLRMLTMTLFRFGRMWQGLHPTCRDTRQLQLSSPRLLSLEKWILINYQEFLGVDI